MRATMLLMAEAFPTWSLPAALIATTVTGATQIPMPMPTTRSAGRTPCQYGVAAPGSASSRYPDPAISAPAMRGRRGPNRSTSPPAQRESAEITTTQGNRALPASNGRNPCTCMSRKGTKKSEPDKAAQSRNVNI